MNDTILYGDEQSSHVRKVVFALEYLQAKYKYMRIDIWAEKNTRPIEFLNKSRFAEVPLLLINDDLLTQLNSILIFHRSDFKPSASAGTGFSLSFINPDSG